jgi:hypothetical protein
LARPKIKSADYQATLTQWTTASSVHLTILSSGYLLRMINAVCPEYYQSWDGKP